jgi:hypothetical protein
MSGLFIEAISCVSLGNPDAAVSLADEVAAIQSGQIAEMLKHPMFRILGLR